MKHLLFIIFFLFSITLNSQTKLNYEFIQETNKSKDELTKITQFFVADIANSSTHITKMFDKEQGIFILKPILQKSCGMALRVQELTVRYTIKILCKNNKYKIIVDDLFVETLRINGTSVYFGHDYYLTKEYPGLKTCQLTKNNYNKILKEIDLYFETFVKEYNKYIEEYNDITSF